MVKRYSALPAATPAESAVRTPQSSGRAPSLRTALRVYALVMAATVAIIVGLVGIDITFLRLVVAVFVTAGFTIGAIFLTGIGFRAVLGQSASPALIGAGFLGGLAIWIPATWLLGLIQQALIVLFGGLPSSVFSSASQVGQGVVFGIILPVCQGLFFFGYFQAAARGLGRWQAVALTSAFYGLYGLMSAGLGLSAVPGYLLAGLVAAVLTERTQSPLVGIVTLSGFFLGEPILGDFVRYSLGTTDTLTAGWLMSVVLSAFIAFLVVQATRLFFVARRPAAVSVPGRLWWLPLLLVGVLTFVVAYGEIATRQRYPFYQEQPTPASGSTAPPIGGPTTNPVLPSATPTGQRP